MHRHKKNREMRVSTSAVEAQRGSKREELGDIGGKEKRGNLVNSISNKIQFKVIIIFKYLGMFII